MTEDMVRSEQVLPPTDDTGGGSEECPDCQGRGRLEVADHITGPLSGQHSGGYEPCDRCDGRGVVVSEWLPISSAPKDGTHILACSNPPTSPYGPHWSFDQRPPAVIHYWDNPGEEGFYLSAGGSTDEPTFPATHWTALPTPPRVAPEARATARSSLSAEGVRDACEASGQPAELNPNNTPTTEQVIAELLDHVRYQYMPAAARQAMDRAAAVLAAQQRKIERLTAFAHPDPSITGNGLIKWRHWQVACVKERARAEELEVEIVKFGQALLDHNAALHHAISRAEELAKERDALKDQRQEAVAAGYRAWPDAEDIDEDPAHIIDALATERDKAEAEVAELRARVEAAEDQLPELEAMHREVFASGWRARDTGYAGTPNGLEGAWQAFTVDSGIFSGDEDEDAQGEGEG